MLSKILQYTCTGLLCMSNDQQISTNNHYENSSHAFLMKHATGNFDIKTLRTKVSDVTPNSTNLFAICLSSVVNEMSGLLL